MRTKNSATGEIWMSNLTVQTLDKIMETLHILYTRTFLYWYGVGPPFAFSIVTNILGICSYKFWIVCCGILCHSSGRTSVFHSTLLRWPEWFVHWCSKSCWHRKMLKFYLHTFQTMTEQFQLCECRRYRLEKAASFIWNNVWIMGYAPDCATCLCTHTLPCSNSAMKGNDASNRIPRYCCP
jgi:hypothetical protein